MLHTFTFIQCFEVDSLNGLRSHRFLKLLKGIVPRGYQYQFQTTSLPQLSNSSLQIAVSRKNSEELHFWDPKKIWAWPCWDLADKFWKHVLIILQKFKNFWNYFPFLLRPVSSVLRCNLGWHTDVNPASVLGLQLAFFKKQILRLENHSFLLPIVLCAWNITLWMS